MHKAAPTQLLLMCAHGDAERFGMEGGPNQQILQEGFSRWPSLAMRRPDLMERWAARQCRRDIYVLHQDGKIATVELQPEGDNVPFVDVLPSRGASAYIGGRGPARDEAGGVDDLEVGSCKAELLHVLLPEETAVESFDLTVDDTPRDHSLPIGSAIESFRLDWDDHSAENQNSDRAEEVRSVGSTAASIADGVHNNIMCDDVHGNILSDGDYDNIVYDGVHGNIVHEGVRDNIVFECVLDNIVVDAVHDAIEHVGVDYNAANGRTLDEIMEPGGTNVSTLDEASKAADIYVVRIEELCRRGKALRGYPEWHEESDQLLAYIIASSTPCLDTA